VLQRLSQDGLALAVLVAGTLAGIAQAHAWARARRQPRWELAAGSDGLLWLRRDAFRAQVRVGPATRLLGPSVFLDVTFATPTKTVRCRRWITPPDAPAAALRRWTVLLPSAGSLAS
jgi:hypothetical protein